MKKRFLIYGLAGLLVETIWTGLGSLLQGDLTMKGWTYLWMFPVYGSAVLLEPVHENLRHAPAVIRGSIYTMLIYAIELITGLLLRSILGRCPWNYGLSRFSSDGIITLLFIPVWFSAGLIFERVHDLFIEKGIGEADTHGKNGN